MRPICTTIAGAIFLLLAACASGGTGEPVTGPGGGQVDPVGTFSYQLTYSDPAAQRAEVITGTISIERQGESYGGQVTASGMSAFPITYVQVARDQLLVQARAPDGPVTLRLTFNGPSFSGQWEDADRTTHPLRGTRR